MLQMHCKNLHPWHKAHLHVTLSASEDVSALAKLWLCFLGFFFFCGFPSPSPGWGGMQRAKEDQKQRQAMLARDAFMIWAFMQVEIFPQVLSEAEQLLYGQPRPMQEEYLAHRETDVLQKPSLQFQPMLVS